jgi:type IV pilus assembly protein PilO
MPWYNPEDPTQRRWLLLTVVALVLIVPYYMYVLTPRQEANAAVDQRVQALVTLNRRAAVIDAQGGDELEQRLALYERHVSRLEQLIPAEEEVAALVDDIGTRARSLRVDLQGLQPQPPEPGEYYDRTSYNMSVIGEYHSVGRFLAEIASLSRIVTPTQVDLQLYTQPDQYPDLESPVLATFRIETYVVPDRTQTPAPAPPAGA